MERKVILTTYSNFVTGIQISLVLVRGEAENVEYLCAYMEQPYDLAKTIRDILKNNRQNELIVVTDLFGGSVSNEFFNYMGKQAVHLISGLNLATLIGIYTQIDTVDSLVDLIKCAAENR